MDHKFATTTTIDYFSYLTHNLWKDIGDQRVQKFPLFKDGPWRMISIVLCYLFFVLRLGPQFMKNRKPFNLKRPVFWYNIIMVLMNGYMFVHILILTDMGREAWGCHTVEARKKTDPIESVRLNVGYVFVLSKIIELLDTVIFVLRKKSNQVTSLHVIHHSLVPILMWIGFKLSPGGNAVFFPLVNAAIHTLMYSYYALSTFGESVRKYLWWKIYITRIQMVQFVLVIIHSLHVLFIPNCNFPKVLLYMSVANALLFLVLFYSFYVYTYCPGKMKTIAKIVIHHDEKARPNNLTTSLATMCFPDINGNSCNLKDE